jgi:hypothetical protein
MSLGNRLRIAIFVGRDMESLMMSKGKLHWIFAGFELGNASAKV